MVVGLHGAIVEAGARAARPQNLHPHPRVGQFAPQRLGEAVQARLARAIHGKPRQADAPKGGADEDDLRPVPGHQRRQQRLRQQHRCHEIGGDNVLQALRRKCAQRAEARYPGRMHDDVGTKSLGSGNGVCPPAVGGQVSLHPRLARRPGAAANTKHLGAGGAQLRRHRLSDPAGRAGQQHARVSGLHATTASSSSRAAACGNGRGNSRKTSPYRRKKARAACTIAA